MSIATTFGDAGQTRLPGGARVSKSEIHVEAYGTIDELISTMGFARSICPDAAIRELVKTIQRELFSVGSALGMTEDGRAPKAEVPDGMVARLTDEVHRLETAPGLLSDWSIPGDDSAAAAFDVARTVCRRAERCAVKVQEHAGLSEPNVIRYLNRLSDLLWLFGRTLELAQGIDSRLRSEDSAGKRWSRAW